MEARCIQIGDAIVDSDGRVWIAGTDAVPLQDGKHVGIQIEKTSTWMVFHKDDFVRLSSIHPHERPNRFDTLVPFTGYYYYQESNGE